MRLEREKQKDRREEERLWWGERWARERGWMIAVGCLEEKEAKHLEEKD